MKVCNRLIHDRSGLLVVALLLVSCSVASVAQEQKPSKIVISVGSCGTPFCSGYQIALFKNNTYSYTLFPHRRVWTGRIPSFAAIVRQLNDISFFGMRSDSLSAPGNKPQQTAVYVKTSVWERTIYSDPGDPNYERLRRLVGDVAPIVQRDVEKQRRLQQHALQNYNDLTAVSVERSPLLRCYGYHAMFNKSGDAAIDYAPEYPPRSARKFVRTRVPFSHITEPLRRFDLSSLYEDYPVFRQDGASVDITLTYNKATYTISAHDPLFWPLPLRNFVSSVDAEVLADIILVNRSAVCGP